MTKEERATAIAEGKKKKQEEKKIFKSIIDELDEKGLLTKFVVYLEKEKEDRLNTKKEQLEKEIAERQKQIEEIEKQLNN